MDKKKQRGQQRKLKRMFGYIDDFTPFADIECGYEHFHVPSSQFIDSRQTSGKIKTAFCRKWLEAAGKFISQKPIDLQFCKVVAVIDTAGYWNSQIIIFYDEEYYKSFWQRTGPEQFWIPIEKSKSFCKIRNITTTLPEIGYVEKIAEDNNIIQSELWFYGDVEG
ncbi:MAG: DUF3916 domain-containing protein [Eubacterium sp.]|nr:DUF3916 domain-containing protein [Eubacterium sp.]